MLEKAAEEQKRQAEEPNEPPSLMMEADPSSAGAQDLPAVLRTPKVRDGSSTECVEFFTSRDVLEMLYGGRKGATTFVHQKGKWKHGQRVVLPGTPRPDSPYRISFAVEADMTVVPLQQCVDCRFEKNHVVDASM